MSSRKKLRIDRPPEVFYEGVPKEYKEFGKDVISFGRDLMGGSASRSGDLLKDIYGVMDDLLSERGDRLSGRASAAIAHQFPGGGGAPAGLELDFARKLARDEKEMITGLAAQEMDRDIGYRIQGTQLPVPYMDMEQKDAMARFQAATTNAENQYNYSLAKSQANRKGGGLGSLLGTVGGAIIGGLFAGPLGVPMGIALGSSLGGGIGGGVESMISGGGAGGMVAPLQSSMSMPLMMSMMGDMGGMGVGRQPLMRTPQMATMPGAMPIGLTNQFSQGFMQYAPQWSDYGQGRSLARTIRPDFF